MIKCTLENGLIYLFKNTKRIILKSNNILIKDLYRFTSENNLSMKSLKSKRLCKNILFT